MADGSNIPSPVSLYPQPPASGGVLGNPANMVDLFGKLQTIGRTQQEIEAQRAIGNAYMRNMDPASGAIDPAGVVRDLSANPAAAYKLPEAMSNLYSQQSVLRQLGEANRNTIYHAFSTLRPGFTDDEANRIQLNLSESPGMDHKMLAQLRAQIPPMPSKSDPNYRDKMAERDNIVRGMGKQLLTAKELEEPVQVMDQYGNIQLVPRTQYMINQIGGAPGTTAPTASGATTPPGTVPGPGMTGPYTPAPYTGGPGVALSAGQQAALKEATEQGKALLNRRDALANEHQLLIGLQLLGRRLDGAFTGPTSQTELYYRGLMGSFLSRIGIDPSTLSDAQLYQKVLAQVMTAQRSGGPQSVADLDVIQHANPQLPMTPHAKEGAVNQLLAMNELEEAKRSKFEAAGGEQYPQIYYEFRKQNPHLDAAVFAFNRLLPDERQEYLAGLTPQQRAQLRDRYRQAEREGLVQHIRGEE